MKLVLSAFLVLFSTIAYSQNTIFSPYEASFETGGTVIMEADNSTIYYTMDGTEPTLASSSGVNHIEIAINTTTTFKAFVVRYGETSPVETIKYYVGEYHRPKLFFKPPTNWNSSCARMNVIEPRTMVDFFGSGPVMESACEGWKKTIAIFAKGIVNFNNCLEYPPVAQYAPEIITDEDVFYDFTLGPISNPPACLLQAAEVSGKTVAIKIFPNPVQEMLNIHSEIKFMSYEIIDASGKVFDRNSLSNNQILVSTLKKGLYFIKLINDGKTVHYIRFIKN